MKYFKGNLQQQREQPNSLGFVSKRILNFFFQAIRPAKQQAKKIRKNFQFANLKKKKIVCIVIGGSQTFDGIYPVGNTPYNVCREETAPDKTFRTWPVQQSVVSSLIRVNIVGINRLFPNPEDLFLQQKTQML